jgi:mono/diheme cytochrome c family protein
MPRPRPKIVLGAVLLLALGIQLVPYGRMHLNPPVVAEPAWATPETRALAVRACFDCHSNETRWPWYGQVAPLSWGLQRHVDEGRRALNFSEWNRLQHEAEDAAETVAEGEMPPGAYRLFHPGARLTDVERRTLVEGLAATPGTGGRGHGAREHGD